MSKVILIKCPRRRYEVVYKDEIRKQLIGEIIQDVDGYYKFFPVTKIAGYWSEFFLMTVLGFLTQLNVSWDRHCQTDPLISDSKAP